VLLARTAGGVRPEAPAGTSPALRPLYPQYAFVTSYCNGDAYTIAGRTPARRCPGAMGFGSEGKGWVGYVGAAAGAVLTGKVSASISCSPRHLDLEPAPALSALPS